MSKAGPSFQHDPELVPRGALRQFAARMSQMLSVHAENLLADHALFCAS
jgi:hypothetical protein